jgi:hypothetical protein
MHRSPRLFARFELRPLAALCQFGLALTLTVAIPACGEATVENATGSGGTGGTGAGGAGGNGAGGGTGGQGGWEAPPCEITTAAHEACGPECPLTLDREIRCGAGFAAAGLRVAPGAAHTYLSATELDGAYLLELTAADGGVRADFPLHGEGVVLELALDGTGQLHGAADLTRSDGSTSPVSYPGGLTYARPEGDGFATETVYDSAERYTPPYDFDLAPDGTAHLWFATYDEVGTDGDAHAARGADGTWSVGDANRVGEYQHWSLDADGQPVSFGIVEAAGGYKLVYGPDYSQLGNPLDGFSPARYRVTHGPAPSAPAGAVRFAAAIAEPSALHLAWPDAQGFQDLTLPGTAAPPYVCAPSFEPDPSDQSCPGDCQETASGLEYDAFAIARTADGAVWVAYVITHFDTTIGYELQCAESYCWCAGLPHADASTAELFVLRFTPGVDQPTTVLDLPIPRLAGRDFLGGMWEDARIVDLRGFGSSVAVGLRLDDETGPYGRVMRFDPQVGSN